MWHDFMFKNGNSGARSDRFSISDSTFSLMPILYPQKEEEQLNIGQVFINMEKLMRTESIKLSKFRSMKQSLLQKMFV